MGKVVGFKMEINKKDGDIITKFFNGVAGCEIVTDGGDVGFLHKTTTERFFWTPNSAVSEIGAKSKSKCSGASGGWGFRTAFNGCIT